MKRKEKKRKGKERKEKKGKERKENRGKERKEEKRKALMKEISLKYQDKKRNSQFIFTITVENCNKEFPGLTNKKCSEQLVI